MMEVTLFNVAKIKARIDDGIVSRWVTLTFTSLTGETSSVQIFLSGKNKPERLEAFAAAINGCQAISGDVQVPGLRE